MKVIVGFIIIWEKIILFEFQGALTHGDRRAGESRDLSRFNIDNKYGRAALEAVFKAIMGYEAPVVKPPADYRGDFFKGTFVHLYTIFSKNTVFNMNEHHWDQ